MVDWLIWWNHLVSQILNCKQNLFTQIVYSMALVIAKKAFQSLPNYDEKDEEKCLTYHGES